MSSRDIQILNFLLLSVFWVGGECCLHLGDLPEIIKEIRKANTQNHILVEVGRDLGTSSHPTPLLRQGHLVPRTGHSILGVALPVLRIAGKVTTCPNIVQDTISLRPQGMLLAQLKFSDTQSCALLEHLFHANSGSVLRIPIFCQLSAYTQWALKLHTCSLCCFLCDMIHNVLLYCMIDIA